MVSIKHKSILLFGETDDSLHLYCYLIYHFIIIITCDNTLLKRRFITLSSPRSLQDKLPALWTNILLMIKVYIAKVSMSEMKYFLDNTKSVLQLSLADSAASLDQS